MKCERLQLLFMELWQPFQFHLGNRKSHVWRQ